MYEHILQVVRVSAYLHLSELTDWLPLWGFWAASAVAAQLELTVTVVL
jgi:hypothetical protein